MTTRKIESTSEAWEDRLLGADEAFVKVAENVNQVAIDESLGLKMISIRLEQSLIEDFKAIATINNMGYQTLMRQALKRFAESEKKLISIDMENRRKAEEEQMRAAIKAATERVEPAKAVKSGAKSTRQKDRKVA
jgi:hypothetical protein